MKNYILIAFLYTAMPAPAQVSLSFATGLGSYSMGDLKSMQKDFTTYYQVKTDVNSDFPPYAYYEGSFSFSYSPKFYSEIFVGYGSTGGRVSYADYSGQAAMTHKVNYTSITGSFGFRWQQRNFEFQCVLRTGTILSTLKIDQFENIGGNRWTHQGKYTCEAFVFEPNFRVTRFSGPFGIFAFAGLNATSGGEFESVDTVDYITTPIGFYVVGADWSGLRIGVGVTFVIIKRKEK